METEDHAAGAGTSSRGPDVKKVMRVDPVIACPVDEALGALSECGGVCEDGNGKCKLVHFVPLKGAPPPCAEKRSMLDWGTCEEGEHLSVQQRDQLMDAVEFCGQAGPVVISCGNGNNRCKLLAALVQINRGVPVTNTPKKPYFQKLVERAEANGIVDARLLTELSELPYDSKVDVWSLGISAIELARMAPPFSEVKSVFQVMMLIAQGEPPALRPEESASAAFRDFVSSALVKEPSARPTSERLLAHPFLAGCSPRELLAAVAEAQARAAAGADYASVGMTLGGSTEFALSTGSVGSTVAGGGTLAGTRDWAAPPSAADGFKTPAAHASAHEPPTAAPSCGDTLVLGATLALPSSGSGTLPLGRTMGVCQEL